MDIFKGHPKEGAGAKAVRLAKHISSYHKEDLNFKEYVFKGISSAYIRVNDVGYMKSENACIKKLIKNIYAHSSQSTPGVTLDLDGLSLPDCFTLIATTLYYSIHGEEKKALEALLDATWLAGFCAEYVKSRYQIREAETTVIKRKARKRAIEVHAKTPKTQAKNMIKTYWMEWQKLLDEDQLAGENLYKNKTSFAHDMLDKFPILAGAKKQDPEVIMGWIRKWEKVKVD
jgi:hypothetical protein